METTTEPDGEITVIDVRGALDLASAPALCHRIEIAVGPRVLVDLRDVTSCDPAGLRALIGAADEARIRMCRLVVAIAPRGALDRLIARAGAQEFLQIERRPAIAGDT